MSHFSVLVIAPDVAAALQPFHEYECTGVEDQYVQDIDITQEARDGYASSTETRLKLTDGQLVSFFDDAGAWRPEFSQPEKSDVFNLERRTYRIPEGCEKVEVPASTVETFEQWVEGYYGYPPREDGRVIKRTNPNKKWDWWQEGGRFSDKLLRKDGKRCDSAKAGVIDWNGMIAAKATDAAETYDRVMAVIAEREVTTWEQFLARYKSGELTIDAARDLYHGQQVVKDLIETKAIDSFYGAETLTGIVGTNRDDYIRRQGQTNASTWAMLFNGEWIERGEMGWFGMSDDTEESRLAAMTKFWNTVRELPDDMLCTVVDCHI